MFTKATVNLMSEDVRATAQWYNDVLDFAPVGGELPEAGAEFVMMQRDEVTIFCESRTALEREAPALKGLPIGGTISVYIDLDSATSVEARYAELKEKVEIVYDLHDTFYNAREFWFKDCNGYVLTYSGPVNQEDAVG